MVGSGSRDGIEEAMEKVEKRINPARDANKRLKKQCSKQIGTSKFVKCDSHKKYSIKTSSYSEIWVSAPLQKDADVWIHLVMKAKTTSNLCPDSIQSQHSRCAAIACDSHSSRGCGTRTALKDHSRKSNQQPQSSADSCSNPVHQIL